MKPSGVKIGAAAVGLLALVSVSGLAVLSSTSPKIQDNVTVNGVEVGGLSPVDAEYKVRVWWEHEKRVPLHLEWKNHSVKFPDLTASKLGFVIDDKTTVDQLPLQSPVEMAASLVHRQVPQARTFPAVLKPSGVYPAATYKLLDSCLPASRPARVEYTPHVGLKRIPEISKCSLNRDGLLGAVSDAVNNNTAVSLPISEGPKHVPDAELNRITDYISSYTTYFPKSQHDRDHNIENAANRINGTVLMPGDTFSFNQTVGQRTVQTGFRLSPVYVNGGHGMGIGGGICQVSTTLYNATLLANMKVVERQNHSMPVGYIPLGRDATVDWGNIDYKFENTSSDPVAICAIYKVGSLSFYVFGQAVKGRTVDIERSPISYADAPVQYVTDKNLPAGKTEVIESGMDGKRIKTWRLVYQDGKLVSKEYLGQSTYITKARVIARGTKSPAPTGSGQPIQNPPGQIPPG